MGSGRQRRFLGVLGALVLLCGPVAWGQESDLAIRNQVVHVDIHGRVATTKVAITYVNYGQRPQEAVHRWTLPPDAVVHDCALWVGGLRSPAELLTRVRAERIYREIRDRDDARDPALLEYLGDGQWNLQVFPVREGGTLKVEYTYSQLLPVETGTAEHRGGIRYTLPRPGTVSTVTEAQDFEFSAVLHDPEGIADVWASQAIGVQRSDANRVVTVGFRRENFDLLTPVEVSCAPVNPPPQVLALPAAANRPATFVTLLPAPATLVQDIVRKRRFVLVIDASESMGGKVRELMEAAAMLIATRLKDTDSLQMIVTRDGEVRTWKPQPVPATPDNRRAAMHWIGDQRPGGGTDLAAALAAAQQFDTDPLQPFILCVFSDGDDVVGAGKDLPDGPASRPVDPAQHLGPGALVFWFYPDLPQRPDAKPIEPIDRSVSIPLADLEAVGEYVGRVLELAAAVRVTDLSVRCIGPDGQPVAVAAGPLTPRDQVAVAWEAVAPGDYTFTVSAKADGADVRGTVTIPKIDPQASPATDPAAIAALEKVVAHLQAERMYNELRQTLQKPEQLDALVEHSRRYRIVTRATSMLVLETDEEYVARGIPREVSFVDVGKTLAEAGRAEGMQLRRLPSAGEEVARELVQARELCRLGRYTDAASIYEQAARRMGGEAMTLADRLREFVALRDAFAAERNHTVRVSRPADPDWYRQNLPEHPVELLPHPGGEGRTAPLGIVVPPENPDREKVEAGLRTRIHEVEFRSVSFGDALDFLRDVSKVNLRVRWLALQDAGIDENTEVRAVKLTDVPVRKALEVVLDDISSEGLIGYIIDDGTVLVSTRDELSRRTEVCIYDVSDLVPGWQERWTRRLRLPEREAGGGLFGGGLSGWGDEPDFDLPDLLTEMPRETDEDDGDAWYIALPGSPTAEGRPLVMRVYGIRDLVIDIPDFNGPQVAPPEGGRRVPDRWAHDWGNDYSYSSPGEMIRKLKDMIRSSVDPSSWQPEGEAGSIDFYRGLLVVRQTMANQILVKSLLHRLRRRMHQRAVTDVPPATIEEDFPEQIFTRDGYVCEWVLQLLAKACEGQLGEHTSVVLVQEGERLLARVGGIWLDTAMTKATRVRLVQQNTKAAGALLAALGEGAKVFRLGSSVVLSLNDTTAVALDWIGESDPDSQGMQAILAAAKR